MRLLKNLICLVNNLLVRVFVSLIKIYGLFVSPLMGRNCRFHPTCSEYAKESLEQSGVAIGLYLSIRRLLKCHPWHPGGLDPVQPKHRNNNSHPQTEF